MEALKGVQSAPHVRLVPGPAAAAAGEPASLSDKLACLAVIQVCSDCCLTAAPVSMLCSSQPYHSVDALLQLRRVQQQATDLAAGGGPPWGGCPPAAARPTCRSWRQMLRPGTELVLRQATRSPTCSACPQVRQQGSASTRLHTRGS